MPKPSYQPVLPMVRLVSATDVDVDPSLEDPAVVDVVPSDDDFLLLPPHAAIVTSATDTTATESTRLVRTLPPPLTGKTPLHFWTQPRRAGFTVAASITCRTLCNTRRPCSPDWCSRPVAAVHHRS